MPMQHEWPAGEVGWAGRRAGGCSVSINQTDAVRLPSWPSCAPVTRAMPPPLMSSPSTCRARPCVVAPSNARCFSSAATPLDARSRPRSDGNRASLLRISSWAGCTPCGLYLCHGQRLRTMVGRLACGPQQRQRLAVAAAAAGNGGRWQGIVCSRPLLRPIYSHSGHTARQARHSPSCCPPAAVEDGVAKGPQRQGGVQQHSGGSSGLQGLAGREHERQAAGRKNTGRVHVPAALQL